MVVNQSTQGVDGKIVVDTIWFDGSREAHATYQEALLEAHEQEIRPNRHSA